jgi:hypothetical protein
MVSCGSEQKHLPSYSGKFPSFERNFNREVEENEALYQNLFDFFDFVVDFFFKICCFSGESEDL